MNGALIFSVKSADDGGAKHTLSDDIVLIRDVVLQFFFSDRFSFSFEKWFAKF